MAEIVQSLFGVSPESYQQAQQQRADAQALQYAQLTPFQQANYAIGRGANMLGGAIGGALGGQDPELQRVTMRQQIARQLNPNDPSSIERAIAALSQAGDAQGAMMLQGEYRKLQESNALVGQRGAAEKASLAQAGKIQLSVEQDAALRAELAKLGPNATEDMIRGVVVKYGDPDKVLAALTSAATRAEDREARADAAKLAADARADAAKLAADARADAAKQANDAKIEAARIQAEARLTAAREAGATRVQLAQIAQQNKTDLAQLTASLKGPKVLSSALQKEEDKELELVDSLTARSQALQPAVASLTPDPVTKKSPLALGPINNLRYQAQNAAGNSTPESRAYAQLQRSVQEATNLKTDAAKGVQTDKDVLRFANELIAAFGKNDTQTTLDALTNFVKSTDTARVNAQKRIDSRRKSQGVEPYYGAQAGTPQNPIKLD
jgi:hypothetical protein